MRNCQKDHATEKFSEAIVHSSTQSCSHKINSMTLPKRPTNFTAFHNNLLLRLAIFHPTLTVRSIKDLRYTSGEFVFGERELRSYCGRLLTLLKTKNREELLAQLDTSIDPFNDVQSHHLLANDNDNSLPLPSGPSPSPGQHLHSSSSTTSTTTMAKTPQKARKSRSSRSPNPTRPSTKTPPPPPGAKNSTPTSFPKLKDTPAWERDAKVVYHDWPRFKEGFNEDHGLMVCSSNVNDSAANPKESFYATRMVKHINSNTMLVEHFQKWISTGFCQDEKKHPAVWIKLPRTLATPIANDMKDLEDLCKFADLCFGCDNKALNEEMKRLYIQAYENGVMDKSIFHVITLPDVSSWVEDDDDEEDTTAKDWYYSNDKFNNFPDKKNKLTIEPGEHELKPVPLFREKEVKHLKGKMKVANGYVMVQVFVEGSQRKLKLSNEAEEEEERDYNDYLEELTRKVDNMSTATGNN